MPAALLLPCPAFRHQKPWYRGGNAATTTVWKEDGVVIADVKDLFQLVRKHGTGFVYKNEGMARD